MKTMSPQTKVFSLFLIVALTVPTLPLPAAQAAAALADPATTVESAAPPAGPLAPPPPPSLSLWVDTSPEEVPPDGVVTFIVRLVNMGGPAQDAVISGTLPAGLECPNCGPFYDPNARRLVWNLGSLAAGQSLDFAFVAQVGQAAGWEGGVALPLQVYAPGMRQPALGSAVVRVPYPLADGLAEVTIPQGQGGQLVSADGRLTVTFPAEAVEVDLRLAYSPTSASADGFVHSLRRFQVNAYDPLDQEVHTFTAPIEIVYRYTWEEALGLIPEEDLFLARWDEELETWVHLPAEVDTERRLLVGQTDHFSALDVGYFDLPSDDYLPAVQGFQEIDLFSGAASYSYPFQVPPGRGGLTPQLSLSYSSGSVDWPAQPWDGEVQAGWVGYGWSLDVGSIGRQNVGGWNWHDHETEPKCEQWYEYDADDVFSLSLNGAGHDLVKGNDGYYHTANETYWRIWTSGGAGPDAWYVRTKLGTTYTFSTTLWQVLCEGEKCDPSKEGEYEIYKWLLTRAEDTHGNVIEYTYAFSIANCPRPGEPPTVTTHMAAYPAEITYNYSGSQPLARIEFELGLREDDDYASSNAKRCPSNFKQLHKLDTITVSTYVDGDWQTVRSYTLAYDYSLYDDDYGESPDNAKLTLRGVQTRGKHAATSLPYTEFDYYYPSPYWQVIGRNRLATVTNSYSGTVTYTYENPTESELGPAKAYLNRVTTRVVDDGLASTDPSTWTYDYAGALRNSPLITTSTFCQDGISLDAGTNQPRTRPNFEFRGHAHMTVTDPLGNVQVHSFHQDDTLRGKVSETLFLDDAGNTYRRLLQSYDYAEEEPVQAAVGDPYSWARPEIAFTYVATETTVTYDGGSEGITHTTVYSYDPGLQQDDQYGNLTHIWDYDENGTLYRTTRRWYRPNTTKWVVGRLAAEATYAGDWAGGGKPASASWYYYDGNPSHLTPPSLGDLTRRQRLKYNREDQEGVITWIYWDTSEATYGYDSYGNRITETTYTDYGQMQQEKDDWENVAWVSRPSQGRTITITYDSVFHLYPLTVTYPNGLVETAGYDYRLGLLTSHTDVNGATTNYSYDDLGRTIKVARPGDSSSKPTVWVDYKDFGFPGDQRVLVMRRMVTKDRGNGVLGNQDDLDVVKTERFFDGLGRLTQVHLEDKEEGGQDYEIVQTTLYNALGQVAAELVPYFHSDTTSYVLPQDEPRTSYAYDPLGRVTVVTHTDGTIVTTHYNLWQTAVVDENDHMVVSENDAFGRLIQVREYTGTYASGPGWSATPYATTTYTYTVLDQLSETADAAGNVTTIEYDDLGRKTAMDDPDMGYWTYGYDAVGNLLTQTDALNQVITFTYDVMDRMTLTSLPGEPEVHFCYDDCRGDAGTANSWGRLRWTWVGEDDTDNGHAYVYDARGRVVSDTVWIDGTGYTTTYEFDSMDRISITTYPDGEVLTHTYADEEHGLLIGLTGKEPDRAAVVLVDGIVYTATRAMDLLELGHDSGSPVLQVDYVYFAWTTVNGRGRLEQIQSGTPGETDSLQDLHYTYDAVGNVLTIEDYKAMIGPSPQTQTFQYDELDRLTSAQASGTEEQGGYGPISYHYDEIGNITAKGDVAYFYNDSDHVHAVTHLTMLLQTDQKYWYNANGNQTKRIVGSDTYTLTYDVQNHLVEVEKNGSGVANFAYGPEGGRISGTVNGVTTIYVGNHYEVEQSEPETVRKYYYANGKRVAMRRRCGSNRTVNWLLSDHLGSTAITADILGNRIAEVRYEAYGEDRFTSGSTPTTFRFTGQRQEDYIKLYYYGARWYDAWLGRFIQPDTIVPDPGDPQAWNRYSYVLNNPLKYTDPTGSRIALEEDFTVRYTDEGAIQVVEGGQRFPNDVEVAVANYLLSGGNCRSCEAILENIPPMALNMSYQQVLSELEGRPGTAGGPNINVASAAASGLAAMRIGTGDAGLPPSSGWESWPEASRAGYFETSRDAASRILLGRNLASQQQMAEPGHPIYGAGTDTPLKAAPRLAETYGGVPSDWAKMSSSEYTDVAGAKFQTHWYQNMDTGLRVEYKSKIAKMLGTE